MPGPTLRAKWMALIVLAGMSGASFFLSLDDVADGPVVCHVRRITGLSCPGCGLTRSFIASAHGQWADAFRQNLFGPPSFIALIVSAIFIAADLMSRGRFAGLRFLLTLRAPAFALVVVWLVWSVGRVFFENTPHIE